MMPVLHACEIAEDARDRRPDLCHEQEGCGAAHTHQSTTLRNRSAFPNAGRASNIVQQTTVSRTKVEDPGYAGRNFFEQRSLSGRSMRHSIGSFEIAGRMLR
jgi:hypothetical protein